MWKQRKGDLETAKKVKECDEKIALQKMVNRHKRIIQRREERDGSKRRNKPRDIKNETDRKYIEDKWLASLKGMAGVTEESEVKRRDQLIAACILICRLGGQSHRKISKMLAENCAEVSRDRANDFLVLALNEGVAAYKANLYHDKCTPKKRGPSESINDTLIKHLDDCASGKYRSRSYLSWRYWPAYELAFFCLSGCYPPNRLKGGEEMLRSATEKNFTLAWYARENKALLDSKHMTEEGAEQWADFRSRWTGVYWPKPLEKRIKTCAATIRKILNRKGGLVWAYSKEMPFISLSGESKRQKKWIERKKVQKRVKRKVQMRKTSRSAKAPQ